MTNEMTAEEAVKILTYERDNDIFVSTEHREKIHKALTMAIQALESQRNLTNEELYQSFIKLEAENERLHDALESSISIPSGATNGDVIKAMFPKCVINEDDFIVITNLDDVTSFRAGWWNAPYREGDAE